MSFSADCDVSDLRTCCSRISRFCLHPILDPPMFASLSTHSWGIAEWGPLLQAFVAFAWLVYAAETWLDWRQHALFFVSQKPAEISYATDDEFRKAQLYGQDKSRLNFVSSLWGVIKLTAQFAVAYYPALWVISGGVMKSLGLEGEITQSLVLYCIDALVESVLGLPLSLYKIFVIEERHGFNVRHPTCAENNGDRQ